MFDNLEIKDTKSELAGGYLSIEGVGIIYYSFIGCTPKSEFIEAGRA